MATVMPRTGLSRPIAGEENWDANLNGWLTKLDTYGGFTDLTATWTALQTFNEVSIAGGTIALTKDSNTLASSGVLYVSPSTTQASVTDFLHTKELADAPTVGRVLRITSSGDYVWTSGTMKYAVRIDGTEVASTPTFTPPGAIGYWTSQVNVLVYSTSSVSANMMFKIDDNSTTAAKVYGNSLNTAPNMAVSPEIATHVTIGTTMLWRQHFCLMEMLN